MKKAGIIATLIAVLVSGGAYSQKSEFKRIMKTLSKTPWLFQVGTNVIDDDGDGLKGIYQLHPYDYAVAKFPSTIGIEKFFLMGFRVQLSGNYNVYKVGKIINRGETRIDQIVYGVDLNVKYGLRELIPMGNYFDPYVLVGYGYTKRGHLENANNNFGVGTNICIYRGFGLNFQAVGKWTLKDGASNYVQYSAGIIYRLGDGSCFTENDHQIRSKKHLRKILQQD